MGECLAYLIILFILFFSADLFAECGGHINLIPLNITDGYAGTATANKAAQQFQRILRDAGHACTFRQRRGIDVAAGCGQLRVEKKERVS